MGRFSMKKSCTPSTIDPEFVRRVGCRYDDDGDDDDDYGHGVVANRYAAHRYSPVIAVKLAQLQSRLHHDRQYDRHLHSTHHLMYTSRSNSRRRLYSLPTRHRIRNNSHAMKYESDHYCRKHNDHCCARRYDSCTRRYDCYFYYYGRYNTCCKISCTDHCTGSCCFDSDLSDAMYCCNDRNAGVVFDGGAGSNKGIGICINRRSSDQRSYGDFDQLSDDYTDDKNDSDEDDNGGDGDGKLDDDEEEEEEKGTVTLDMSMFQHGEGMRPCSLEAYRQRQMFLHSYKFTRRTSARERLRMHLRRAHHARAAFRRFCRNLRAKLRSLSDYISFHRTSFLILSNLQLRPSLLV